MATVTWTGAVSTTYSTDGNWDTGSKPTSSDDVIIANVTNDCVLTGSPTVNSWTVQSGARFNGNTETITVVGENSSGFAIDIDGEVVGTTTNFTVETPASTTCDFQGTSGNVRHVTINHASCDVHISGNTTFSGNLTITAGTFDCSNEGGDSRNLTVTGDESVTGTLTGNASAISLGSLTIASGGTYSATSGTTTLTSFNSSNNIFKTESGGTFTHNNGTVKVTTNSSSKFFRPTNVTFYNVQISNNDTGAYVRWRGTPCTISNNLTIDANSKFKPHSVTQVLNVTGDVNLSGTNSFLDGNDPNNDASTQDWSFGSLTIASGATYRAPSGTTTITSKASSNFAFKNEGTFTHNSGTMQIGDGSTSTGGVHLMNTTYHNLIINRDQNAPDGNTPWRPSSGTEVTIAGNLTVTKGRFYRNNSSNSLVVTGDVNIAANGQVGTSAASGSNTFGSLTINSGGTYLATSGTTIMKGALRNVGGTIS